jgi:hypothetical protein
MKPAPAKELTAVPASFEHRSWTSCVTLPGRDERLMFAANYYGTATVHLVAIDQVRMGPAPHNSLCGRTVRDLKVHYLNPIEAFALKLCPNCHMAGLQLAGEVARGA